MSLTKRFDARRAAGVLCLVSLFAIVTSCATPPPAPEIVNHSWSRPQEVAVTHISLDLTVDFDRQVLKGTARLDLDNRTRAKRLILDDWALDIKRVTLDDDHADTKFTVGESVSFIGSPLVIDIKPDTRSVTIEYETTNDARGVQWLRPEQTGDREHPFLYTQSQAILARSWVPCQDNPAVKITYDARVQAPAGLMALMSARNAKEVSSDGVYTFDMPQPIPSYLLALVVGDIAYQPISERCGVYAEPGMLEAAAWEFADMEKMMEVAEKLYGPYRWEQYDVIVLPPSFPYGGMENPRLTFVTPILVAGDRSLISTIPHELAHSWSGNLVTMATWDDFWLNEGFTTYFERRISEVLYGREITEMNALLGYQELLDEIATDPDSLDTALHIPLNGRDPDEELGTTPYEKGYLFLRLLEETVGREKFDTFLRTYFDTFAFQTMTSQKFLDYMKANLLGGDDTMMQKLRVDEWVWKGGLPDNAPIPVSDRFQKVEAQASAYQSGTPLDKLETAGWTSPEWQHFLAKLTEPISAAQMSALNARFHFSSSNGEVQRSWYLKVIENKYEPGYPGLEAFLVRVGRRWLITPLYRKLAETDDGLAFARRVYEKARPGYHSVSVNTVDGILGWSAN